MIPDVYDFNFLTNYLLIGATLLALGMIGFLSRRNMIIMFLSVEMMIQGSALTLVGFGQYHANWSGQVFTIITLTVAASEAAIALALVLILYNRRESLDVSLWRDIHEPTLPTVEDDVIDEAEPAVPVPGPDSYPHLTPSGVEPPHPLQPWTERRD